MGHNGSGGVRYLEIYGRTVMKGIEFNRPGNTYLECRLQPENPPNEEAVGALKI